MKRVRMLLRVSSEQQLEADGDLSIQRAILKEYIANHEEWILDDKEYFEGSKSAYKNTAEERDVLQEILDDAKEKEFDILVPYKDDRVGRLMLNTSLYIVTLKKYDVDVYSVKDGCISPKSVDDIEGMMMLIFRYANAQKSSKDTGMRVKDTAEKLVQQGKFMGGSAPYGYRLDYSGEISKHGRALKHLVIKPEQAEIVKFIYYLSLIKEYGSAKIASTLNKDDRFKNLAPNDFWKSGTITSILTNPIYAGHTAYHRRERVNGKHHRLGSEDWIISFEPNKDIIIIDSDTWNKVQDKRKQRREQYLKKPENKEVKAISRNDGELALIDVLHCGYCGCKMTNGTKYNYWKIKKTGEKRSSRVSAYRCQTVWKGISHEKVPLYRADKIEPVVFEAISKYIGKLQENEDVFKHIQVNQNSEMKVLEKNINKEKQEYEKIQQKICVMESNLPNAMMGEYPLTLDELVGLIKRHKVKMNEQQQVINQKEAELKKVVAYVNEWREQKKQIPTWQEVFKNSDTQTKRVLINKIVERMDLKQDKIVVRFKIDLSDFFNPE